MTARLPPTPVLRLPENTLGRDFVIGDIHGAFSVVVEAIKLVQFDPKKDRLFSLGDTIDRGPESRRAQRFLSTPWVHAIRGNHVLCSHRSVH